MNDSVDLPQESEREALENRAKQLGISFHPNISDDKLRERVNAELSSEPQEPPVDDDDIEDFYDSEEGSDEEPEGEAPEPVAAAPAPVQKPRVLTEGQKNAAIRKDAQALVRCRITCMNPMKREWEGELFTVANSLVNEKRYVPFNVDWHVPRIMFNMIQERMCQVFHTVGTGENKRREGKLVKEFGIEILPDLTEAQLKDLAQRQAMANGTSS